MDSTRPDSSNSQRRVRRWLLSGLVALAVLPYANALEAGFVYDDSGLVVRHPAVDGDFDAVQALTTAYWGDDRAADTALWRPVTTLSFALDAAIAHDRVRWMHAVNIALHAAVVVLGFVFAQRLGASRNVAAACAALFAVHPLHTEAVTWISGRAELLAALAALVAMLTATAPQARTMQRAGACAAATFLAVASKESAAFLPFAIAFLGWARGESLRRLSAPAIASLTAVLAYAALRFSLLASWGGPIVDTTVNPMAGTTVLERLPTVLDAAGRYLWLLAWPDRLSIDYAPPLLGLADGVTAYGTLGIIVSLALAGLAFGRAETTEGRAAGVAICSFAVASNLLVVIGTNFAERLFYLPSYGLLLLVALLGARLPVGRATLTGLLALALAAGGARSWVQNQAYENDLTLAEATLAAYPRAPKMSYNRARALLARDRLGEAIEQAQWTLTIRPRDSWARIVLANALVRLDRGDEAEVALRAGFEVAPRSKLERARLLELLDARGAVEEADQLAEWALTQGASEPPWPARAAAAAQRRGELELATQRWRQVTRAHPASAHAWTELAKVAYGAGDSALAHEGFERAIALEPTRAEAANGLAWMLLEAGREPGRALALAALAVGKFERADYLDTHARALAAAGRCEEALAQARKAADLEAEYVERHNELAASCPVRAAPRTSPPRIAD